MPEPPVVPRPGNVIAAPIPAMAALDLKRRRQILAFADEHPGWGAIRIARALRVSSSAVSRTLRAVRAGTAAPQEAPPAVKPPTYAESGSGAVAEAVDTNPRTLDDLLKVCRVDLSVWEVDRHVVNKWEVAMKMKVRVNGREVNTPEHRPLYQIKAFLRRRQPVLDATSSAQVFREFLARSIKPLALRPAVKSGEILYELSIPDLHLGKLAWGKETGHADYDSGIAARIYRQALDGLLTHCPAGVGRFLLPLGNDFFNVDSDLKQTTGGTPQDEDSRWQRSFKAGCALALEAVSRLAKQAPVDVVMVSGNHDYQRVFYLGVFLEASFAKSPNVTIHNEPTQRKYIAWGGTLLGFTHGDKEKQDDLPLIMASERADLWSRTQTREWHLGHEHKEKVKSKCGVTVRVIPSLCPPESWHAGRGYIGGQRQACAFAYDRQGLISQHYHTIRSNETGS